MNDDRLRDVSRKFQNEMQKLGLGVTISVPGREPVAVTHYCKVHDRTSPGATCPLCADPGPDADEHGLGEAGHS